MTSFREQLTEFWSRNYVKTITDQEGRIYYMCTLCGDTGRIDTSMVKTPRGLWGVYGSPVSVRMVKFLVKKWIMIIWRI